MAIVLFDGITLRGAQRVLCLASIQRTTSIRQAAHLLGISPDSLHRRLKKWGWDPKAIREGRIPERVE